MNRSFLNAGRRCAAGLGAALSVAVAGLAPGPQVVGLPEPTQGLTVRDDIINVPAGTWLHVGEGRAFAVTLEPAGASFDLVMGPPDQPLYSAGLSDERLGLYDAEGMLIGRGGGFSPNPGQSIRFELGCHPPLQLRMDDKIVDIAEAPQG